MCTPQCICEKLGGLAFDEAIKKWKYVRHYTENLQKLHVKLRDLGVCMETITRKVDEAIGRDDEIEVNVPPWRTDAESLKDDIEQLIGERTTKASISCIACSCPNIVWRYKFSKQAEEKIAEAVELIGKYNNFNHQISHPRSHYAENLQKLKAKLRDLDDCRETITREVSEANGRGDEIEDNVLHWQTEADSLLDDIEQFIRESTNICSTECPSPDIMWQYKFSKQAEEKIAGADGLIIKYHNFNHQISHPRPRPPELESLSDKNYVNFDSRASIFKDIMDALRDSNVNIIGVFGLGGVGKTTLVKEVAEQMRKDGTFKQVAMAVVSRDMDINVKDVQSRLAASLNFKFKAEADDQVGRATDLWNKLTNGDKYLIILDDIWEKVDLKEIGIPCTDKKKSCKVVLTSRKEDLLRTTMKADRNFRIGELSEAEAMDLFKKKVGKTIESQPEIDSLAQEMCRKCKGLPVAINAIGAALEDKPYRTWKNALDKLERHMFTQIEGIDPSVRASLYVSYDMLRSSDAQSRSDAQSCFLLCCLFHEDAEIPIDELTRLCIARSLLAQNPFTLDEARNAVHTVVDALKLASLLTTGSHENVVRIHDVIRDVGISITRDLNEAFLIDHGAPQWPPIPQNAPSYSAISLAFKDIKRLPSGLVYPQLHTLIVENSKLSDVEFPNNFFNGMTQLSVLEITTMRMRRLPSSLAKLAKLRMLYLDGCELADIAVLKHLKSNLEVLGIRRSSIEALPPEIGQLTSLRVLDLEDCDKLRVIPRGVISNLTGLEELYFPLEFAEWKATIDEQQDTSNRDNVSLEDLRRLLNDGQLTTLQIHIPDVKLLPNDDLIFANLKGFKISVGSNFDSGEEKLSTTRTCMLKAEGIQLRNELISLVDKAEVLVLEGIQLTVYPFRLSNKLTMLTIEKFELKYLFTPTTAKELVHLEKLEVRSCEIMEGIVGFEGQKDENEITGEVKFSKLKRLELRRLPNLISFFAKKEEMGTTMGSFSTRAQPLFNEQVIFPVLERLIIDGLGNIIKIWDKQLVVVWQEQGSFCQLTDLVVRHCSKLMHVFPSNMHLLLKNLEELDVSECETMKRIVEFEGERDEDGVRNEVTSPVREHLEMAGVTEIQDKQSLPESKEEVQSLCRPVNNDDIIVFPRLEIVGLFLLPQLKSFYSETQGVFFSHKVAFPVLEHVILSNLDKITRIWDNQPPSEPEKEAKSFSKLQDIYVDRCNQLEYVLPSYMLPQLKNILQELSIWNCKKVEVIISSNPQEKEANNNNDTIRFPQLKTLELKDLPNFKSFICSDETQLLFSNKVAFSVLEKLILSSLDKITRIWDNQPLSEPEKEAKSFSKLQDIYVFGCNQLEYVLPSYMLPQLKNILQELSIRNCKEVEVIISSNPQEKEANNNNDTIRFPQLKTLELKDLPNFKSFICSDETQLLFSNKVAFPVLEKLILSSLDKITRIWDNQPLSEPEKEAKSFSKLQDIYVFGCNQLEYVLPSYMLPQLKNILQELSIWYCTKVEVIISNNPKEKEATNNNDTIRFPQLKTLELKDLPNFKGFICSHETQFFFSNKVIFPVLKKLSIQKMNKIIEIWGKQSTAVLEEQGFFCQLTDLEVSECEKLMHVFHSKMHLPLKNLKVLRVSDCPTMEGIVEFEGEIDEDGLRNEVCFSELSSLELSSLPNLKSFCAKLGKAGTTEGNSSIHALPLFNGKVAFPVLESLDFKNLSKITRIWDEQPLSEQEKEAKSFCKLMVIKVEDCDQLEYVLPSYALPQFINNLQNLTISGCTKMEVIISNNPKEKEAANNTDAILFPQLKEVRLWGLPNLKSFICIDETQLLFSNKVIFPVLKKLSIQKVHKIIEIWDKQSIAISEEQGSFCRLKDLEVSECEKLMHVFPSKMHSPLKNLKVLRVSDCPTMEGIIQFEGEIDEDGLRNYELCFSKLSSLELSGLANLESFCTKLEKAGTTEGNSIIHALPLFNRKVAFPVLETLKFRDLHKITRIWDNQLLSEREQEAKSFCKLKEITVEDCDQLEYVLPLYMLPQLKNLEELDVERCRKMEVIISNNPQEKEATNNNDTIRFPRLKEVLLVGLPNLKSFICSDETQLFFSNKVTFPVLEIFVLAELDKITRIWNNQPLSEQEKEAKSFSKLKSIYVVRCEHLEYVLPFYMLSQLKNLQELWIRECRKMEVIISNNPKEKEATNNNDTIRFPQLKEVKLKDLPNLKSFMRSETQLLFSDKDAFPVLEKIKLRPRGTLEFLGNGTSTEDETSTEDDTMEEWSTSNEESDHSGEKLDEDSETPTTEVSMEECSTSGEESDHNGEELDEDLETPTKEDCNTSGEESDHNGEELDEDLETPMKEGCGTSGKQNDHNGEQG